MHYLFVTVCVIHCLCLTAATARPAAHTYKHSCTQTHTVSKKRKLQRWQDGLGTKARWSHTMYYWDCMAVPSFPKGFGAERQRGKSQNARQSEKLKGWWEGQVMRNGSQGFTTEPEGVAGSEVIVSLWRVKNRNEWQGVDSDIDPTLCLSNSVANHEIVSQTFPITFFSYVCYCLPRVSGNP